MQIHGKRRSIRLQVLPVKTQNHRLVSATQTKFDTTAAVKAELIACPKAIVVAQTELTPHPEKDGYNALPSGEGRRPPSYPQGGLYDDTGDLGNMIVVYRPRQFCAAGKKMGWQAIV